MEQTVQKNWYLLLDSDGKILARGRLESPPGAPNMQIRILEDNVSVVLEHETIHLIGISDDIPALIGRVIGHRKDVIVLEKLKNLSSTVRQNLRIPTSFNSFIYPITGHWRGRRSVKSNDLSCGGISFFCEGSLDNGEQLEIVIPITSNPLVLRCEVLRQRPSDQNTTFYAAKFLEMCYGEEMLVREAVFNIQLQSYHKP